MSADCVALSCAVRPCARSRTVDTIRAPCRLSYDRAGLAAACGTPRGAPRDSAGSHHLEPPLVVSTTILILRRLLYPVPERAALVHPRQTPARSRSGRAG